MLKTAIQRAVHAFGYEIHRAPPRNEPPKTVVTPKYDKIHYGSYTNFMANWLNVDILKYGPENYMYVNLVTKHPFPDNFFRFGFTEDFIEHLSQADSLTFLSEAHRTLKRGGVLRVSFPGLEGVLQGGFTDTGFEGMRRGKAVAYDKHGHLHFYSRDSLSTVARHLGFAVEFVKMSESRHHELKDLDTRLEQISNIHAELTKN
jgi:predicted SAM-dependent methyltransferase